MLEILLVRRIQPVGLQRVEREEQLFSVVDEPAGEPQQQIEVVLDFRRETPPRLVQPGIVALWRRVSAAVNCAERQRNSRCQDQWRRNGKELPQDRPADNEFTHRRLNCSLLRTRCPRTASPPLSPYDNNMV
jgi:hypothetical protein